MKLLIAAESFSPAINGVQNVVKNIAEGLQSIGHEIHVLTSYHPKRQVCYTNGIKVIQFNITGKWIRGFNGEVNAYKAFLLNSNYDVIITYAALQWTTDLMMPLLDKINAKKIIIPCGYSSLNNWKWFFYYLRLPIYLKKFDKIIYHSQCYQDKKFGDKHNLEHYEIIPNGISLSELKILNLIFWKDMELLQIMFSYA